MTEPLPRSGGTVFVQVLVAALFLAVIGGSVGLALGLRDHDGAGGGAADGGGDRGGGVTRPGSGATRAGGGVTRPGGDPSSTLCPDRTARQAGRDLVQVFHLVTANSEVWICDDGGGGLFYQGHRFSDESWLFLTDVEEMDGGYLAANPSDQGTTYYRVSRQSLVIDSAGGGEPEEQPAVAATG